MCSSPAEISAGPPIRLQFFCLLYVKSKRLYCRLGSVGVGCAELVMRVILLDIGHLDSQLCVGGGVSHSP